MEKTYCPHCGKEVEKRETPLGIRTYTVSTGEWHGDECAMPANKPVKEFLVGFWYTEYGSKVVKAETPEIAEQIVHDMLAEYGTEAMGDYNCNDRDYGAQDAEEI
jgi:hypothetical protein